MLYLCALFPSCARYVHAYTRGGELELGSSVISPKRAINFTNPPDELPLAEESDEK